MTATPDILELVDDLSTAAFSAGYALGSMMTSKSDQRHTNVDNATALAALQARIAASPPICNCREEAPAIDDAAVLPPVSP